MQNNLQATYHRQETEISPVLDQELHLNSNLSNSEWILFSPNEADSDLLSHFPSRSEDCPNVEDVLSSHMDEQEEDSLLESLVEESSINRSTDLGRRIDCWKQEQLSFLMHDLSTQSDNLAESWGIEDPRNTKKFQNLAKYSAHEVAMIKRMAQRLSSDFPKGCRPYFAKDRLANPELEKYLPVFLKNLIDQRVQESPHFWSGDLHSCRSSAFSSVMLDFY